MCVGSVCVCVCGGGAKTLGDLSDRALRHRAGTLEQLLTLKFLRQLRPPDRIRAPTNRCFTCLCLPPLL